MTLTAFLTRRSRKETVMTETTTTPTEAAADDVVMCFLTQGSAVVELHRQDRRVRTRSSWDSTLLPNGEARISHGFNWRCLGCDAIGGGGRYGMNDKHFDEHQPEKSRDEANEHADRCRSMPKPTV